MHCNAYVLTLCFVVWSHALRSTLAIRGDTLTSVLSEEGIGKKIAPSKSSGTSGRGARCEICLEVVSSTTKAFPCSDGELCGFNCGNLCNGLKPELDSKVATVSSIVDFKPPPKPCVRGELCKTGTKKFFFDPEVRSFIQYLSSCQVKPYAICAALHQKFPDLKPTCDSKDCRDSRGELIPDKCTGINDYKILHSDDCEKNMACEPLKNPDKEAPVSDECVACYWIIKSFPIFNGKKCSDLPEGDLHCPEFYEKYNIDKDDVTQLSNDQEDSQKAKSKSARKDKKKVKSLAQSTVFLESGERHSHLRLSKPKKAFDFDKFVNLARDQYMKRIDADRKSYSMNEPWFCSKCGGVCEIEDEKKRHCALSECRGNGSPLIQTPKQLVAGLNELGSLDPLIDTCYNQFTEFQASMKARAIIALNQRDPTTNDLNPITSDMATCMCLGLCPFTSSESTTLEGGMCSYNPDEQMSNMEDLSTPGFKLLYYREKQKLLWSNSVNGFDKLNIEKMDALLPFVNSEKVNNDIANEASKDCVTE